MLAQYMEALHKRDQSIIAWEQFFESAGNLGTRSRDTWDVLLCPPCTVTAFPHQESGSPLLVDGHEVDYMTVGAHTTVFNYPGHPAIVAPYKLDRNGLPIGIQLIGKRWNESRLLAIAKALTQLTGPFQRPPGY